MIEAGYGRVSMDKVAANAGWERRPYTGAGRRKPLWWPKQS
nr:hypothetical protein [Mycobacterium sp. Marseille-P9652]